MEQKFKFEFFHFLGPKMQKRLKIHQKWQKIEISDLKLFDYFDLGEHEFWIKSVDRTFFLNEMGLKKRKIREKYIND